MVPCYGYYLDICSLTFPDKAKKETNPKILLNDLKAGEDYGKTSWYADPHAKVTIKNASSSEFYSGTFRSPECTGITSTDASKRNMCSLCVKIPKLVSDVWRKHLKLVATA